MSWRSRDGGYESNREPDYLRGVRGERMRSPAQDKLDALSRRPVIRIGVDLGQSQDYSALAVTEQIERDGKPAFVVRTIERLPLGSTYAAAAERVAFILGELRRKSDADEADGRPGVRLECVIDRSGVGAAAVELFRERGVRPLVEVTIVGGDAVTERADDGRIMMGKVHMITRMRVQHEQRRLDVPRSEMGRLFADELRDFRGDRTPAGNQTFSARSGAHDDVLIAAALSTGTGLPATNDEFILVTRNVKGRW